MWTAIRCAKVASGYNPGSHLDRSWFESSITQYELKYGFLPVDTTVLKNWEREMKTSLFRRIENFSFLSTDKIYWKKEVRFPPVVVAGFVG